MTNIKDFDQRLLNIDRVYDIKYIKDLNISNYLYLVFNNLGSYIKKSGENKYFIFASTDKN